MAHSIGTANKFPASLFGQSDLVSRASCDRTSKTDDAAANPQDGAIPEQDIAAYMADMLLELRGLARKSGFDTLGRVLEIAESEAKLRVGSRR